MLNTRKLKVTDLNPHLICVLCGGYYIDATTIIECLHSFCRSCIVRYLESNKYCPICDVQVHKTRPLQNIRPDPTLQTIVYKLVPGLYQNEMRCRREFYAKHPEAKLQVQNPEARGELTDQSSIFLPDDQISICLEYMDSSESQQGTYGRRYLRCPAAVTVLHLHKLIRAKFGLTSHKVDVMYKEDILLDNWTLMDVAYIYQWRRKCPIHLTYRILEIRRKRVSLPIENAQSTVDESTAAKTPRKENDTSVSTTTEGSSATKSAGDSKKLPTYQLRISENGVMSVTGIENANRLLAPPQLVNVDDFESSVVKETITNKKNSLESTKDTEVENTTANVSKSIPTSNSSSLTTSTPTSSKSSSSTSITTSTSTPSSSIKAQAVTTFEVGDNRTRISESVNSTSSPKTATKPCSDKSLVQIQTSNVEQNKPKDNNNVRNVKTANRPAVDSNNIGKTNIPVKAEANARDSISQSKTEASIKSDSVCNSNKNTSRAETPKEDVSTKASKDLSSNLVDIFPCEPPRPSNSFKVYPGVKSISTPITAPLAKDDPAKQNFQKTNAVAHPKPTPMEILNAAVPQKAPNSTNKYKTLKSPSKSWNPTMPRSTILSMKHPQAAVNQSKDPSSTTVSDVAHPPPAKQPKFFKLRNMPRFLGNPASGVKPMFQVAPGSEVVSQSPSTSANTTPSAHKSAKTTNSSITLMKIDPKTLCPIPVNPVSHVLSSPPKTTSSPPPKKLPPPYTPGSPKTTNHYSNSRTNASASKAPVPRIPSPAHTGALIPSNPFMPSVAHNNAHLLYNAFPTPFSATDPSASRLLPGAPNTELIRAMSALCSSGAAYHPSLPPSISMLFNPHHPHHRLTQVDRAAFKSLTEDKTPSPPAVQRIPPSNALGSKSNSDLAQATNSTSSSTSQNNSTKKEKVESDSKTKTSPTTTVQPKKIESGVSRQSSPLPCEPITTHADSKAAPPAEKSTDSKTNSETNPPSKTKSLDAKVNHVDNNSESKPAPSKDTEKVKSNININSISCKAKVEKSPVHEKQVDSSNMKEKKEIPKNNNYTNKAASFTEGSKGNIMITTESSLKV